MICFLYPTPGTLGSYINFPKVRKTTYFNLCVHRQYKHMHVLVQVNISLLLSLLYTHKHRCYFKLLLTAMLTSLCISQGFACFHSLLWCPRQLISWETHIKKSTTWRKLFMLPNAFTATMTDKSAYSVLNTHTLQTNEMRPENPLTWDRAEKEGGLVHKLKKKFEWYLATGLQKQTIHLQYWLLHFQKSVIFQRRKHSQIVLCNT